MRLALQRLLSKPSASSRLRRIIDTLTVEPQQLSRRCRRCLRVDVDRRWQGTNAAAAIANPEDTAQTCSAGAGSDTPIGNGNVHLKPETGRGSPGKPHIVRSRLTGPYGQWNEALWSPEELEFESDLDDRNGQERRLLDLPESCQDLKLWGCLFEYRKRRYGSEGVWMFWKAIYRRKLVLPMEGQIASQFWVPFITLAVKEQAVMSELWEYVQYLESATGRYWRKLYVTLFQDLLCYGRGREAVIWHDKFFSKFPPSDDQFFHMCRYVIIRGGDLAALQTLYRKSLRFKIYAKILKTLCKAQNYESAYEWHFTCFENSDVPRTLEDLQPLFDYLRVYQPRRLEKITQSLLEKDLFTAEVNFNEDLGSQSSRLFSHHLCNDRSVTTFNDGLGARWCATNWMSLDTTFKAMHALGIDQIGPLTLQAIAVRDPGCRNIAQRIEQLSDLKISLGPSRFSRSMKFLAENDQFDIMTSLLESDQHPEEYDKQTLQEQLLIHYAKTGPPSLYNKTLAVLLLDRSCPQAHRLNLELMCHIHNDEYQVVMAKLHNMHTSQIYVLPWIVHHIIRVGLRPRQRGRRPMVGKRGCPDDLAQTIVILQSIMRSGSFVPVLYWREIIRRLGMLGRMIDLNNLLMFLVSHYGSGSSQTTLSFRRHRRYTIPPQISAAHPSHPLKKLIPVSLQKAIVEWSFKHSLSRQPDRSSSPRRSFPFTYGIQILQLLHRCGVDIDSAAVRSAIFKCLMVLFGSSRYTSNKRINRVGRNNNTLTLEEMVSRLDDVMGQEVFGGFDLRKALQQHGKLKTQRNFHVWQKRTIKKPTMGWD